MMQAFANQMRDFEARMMANVTAQLESFRGQPTAQVQEVSGSGPISGARLVPREDVVIPMARPAPQVHDVWMLLLERYQKMRPLVFNGGNDDIAAEI